MMPSDLHLLRPLWLLALLPLALLLLFLWRQQRQAGAAIWQDLVDPHLLTHLLTGTEGRTRRWPLMLLGCGWLLLVLALSGPVWERLPQPVFTTGSRLIILLDLSPSMNAADVPPSRLAQARFEILDLLRASSEGQVALIAFSSEPFVVSPLSGDAQTIAAQVPQLTTDLIPVPGARRTDLALKLASEMLERTAGQGGELILVTDAVGEMAGALEVARHLQTIGQRLSVLAVGTTKGAPVPTRQGGFINDQTGGIQMARLETDRLRELATAGQGRYLEASVGDRDTKAIIEAGSPTDTIKQTALTADQWREEGPWLLLVLLPLAALAFRRGWLLPVLALLLILPPRPGFAFGWPDLWWRADQQASRQLDAGHAQAAADQFQNPDWRAAAQYRASDYQAALDTLSGAVGADADYNRGNALARLGRLQEAVAAYERTLKHEPDHADARANLALVRKLLEQQTASNPSQDQQKNPSQGQQNPSSPDSKKPSQNGSKPDQHQGGQSSQQAGADGQQANQTAAQSSAGKTGEQNQPDKASGRQPSTPEPSGAKSAAAGRDATPDGRDFSQASRSGSAPQSSDQMAKEQPAASDQPAGKQTNPKAHTPPRPASLGEDALTPQAREQQQAMEAQLQRVPDDPAGLLRQRFLLQHLRREGHLP